MEPLSTGTADGPPLAARDARLAEAVERCAALARASGAAAIVPDTMADDLRRDRRDDALWVGYSQAAASPPGPTLVLAYVAELHRLPAGFAASLFSAWKPVSGNEACVLFARGLPESAGAAPAAALRSLAFFVAKLAELERAGGVYRASSGLRFRCARGASDFGTVEEAAQAYAGVFESLGDEDQVLDLGGHIGAFAVPAAARARRGRVVSYEPDPASLALLRENVRLNGLSNVEAVGAAASSRGGPGLLYRCGANPAISNLYRPYGDGGTVEVPMRTLPEILDAHGLARVDCLKLDIEGAEYGLLSGHGRLLRERVRRLVVEAHKREGGPERMQAFLSGLGYRVTRAGDVVAAEWVGPPFRSR